MPLSKEVLDEEKHYLKDTLEELNKQIGELGQNLQVEEVDLREARKFMWDNMASMDAVEIKTSQMMAEQEFAAFDRRAKYLKKLYKVRTSPYFGRVDFIEKDTNKERVVYIGITHLTKNEENLIYDWRAPISSLFYDYELGNAKYEAPEGIINRVIN